MSRPLYLFHGSNTIYFDPVRSFHTISYFRFHSLLYISQMITPNFTTVGTPIFRHHLGALAQADIQTLFQGSRLVILPPHVTPQA